MQISKPVEATASLRTHLKNTPLIIWDKDGTITGSINPNDESKNAQKHLPNVDAVMRRKNGINIIFSGCKTPESELQNFDPEKVAAKLKLLMRDLPIFAATFSPSIGGVECYLLLRGGDVFQLIKAHEQDRYKKYIGQFKKPGIGMLAVIKDVIVEHLNLDIEMARVIFIGDTWHAEGAAKASGMTFLQANDLHALAPEGVFLKESSES